ncbi:MAG: hypothetical protein ACK502_06960 [Alphaproteobacteria bacterium]
MNDQDSYGLYCAMLLQEYQQHGTALNGIDPSIVDACQHYLDASSQSYHENNKEGYL